MSCLLVFDAVVLTKVSPTDIGKRQFNPNGRQKQFALLQIIVVKNDRMDCTENEPTRRVIRVLYRLVLGTPLKSAIPVIEIENSTGVRENSSTSTGYYGS